MVATAVVASVLLGAAVQRATGFGFALAAAPALAVSLGASTGVALVALLGSAVSLVVLYQTLHGVDWRSALLLSGVALLAIPPGQALADALSEPVLLVTVGTVTLAAVTLTAAADRPVPDSPLVVALVGAAAGLMNVTAGLGGPALASYATSRRWPPLRTVATSQVVLLSMSAATLAAKGWPVLPAPMWPATAFAVAAGAAGGHVLARRLPATAGRHLVVALGALGGIAAIARGTATLLAG